MGEKLRIRCVSIELLDSIYKNAASNDVQMNGDWILVKNKCIVLNFFTFLYFLSSLSISHFVLLLFFYCILVLVILVLQLFKCKFFFYLISAFILINKNTKNNSFSWLTTLNTSVC